jgi:hypothetical protein
MIRIRDLLDYYDEDGLLFNQVMKLYEEGKVQLTNGAVSHSDLSVLYEECDLDPIDPRKMELKRKFAARDVDTPQKPDVPLEELVAKAESIDAERLELHKTLRRLRSRGRANTPDSRKATAGVFYRCVEMAEVYEQIILLEPEERHYSEKAIQARVTARQVMPDPQSISEKRDVADNILKIAEANIRDCGTSDYEELRIAQVIYTELLDNIRNEDSRSRAEENAKLGVISLIMYRITGEYAHLMKAEEMLTAYDKINPESRYFPALIDVMRLKGAGQQDE